MSVCMVLLLLAGLMGFSGCAGYRAHKVGPTSILQAQQEVPENQLLDVSILPFDSTEQTGEQAEDEGAQPDIRKAEGHYMAVHLRNTMQRSAHWGAVRVVPSEASSMDVQVSGKILESNGETLAVEIKATDAAGRTWLKKPMPPRPALLLTAKICREKKTSTRIYTTPSPTTWRHTG